MAYHLPLSSWMCFAVLLAGCNVTVVHGSVYVATQFPNGACNLRVNCSSGHLHFGNHNAFCNRRGQLKSPLGQCFNYNECWLSIDDCHAKATCQDTDGSYTCHCQNGYTGNGQSCTDIDECMATQHNCSQSCKNTIGSYRCYCRPGYNAKRESCIDINECNGSPCQRGSCHNTNGSYTCQCPPGYSGKTCNNFIGFCGGSTCSGHGICSSSSTSKTFTCSCKPGYTGPTCSQVVDGCNSSPCRNGGSCNNTLGSYLCTCPPGYEGAVCDADVNECNKLSPCQRGLCQNTNGSYACHCPPGYSGKICDNFVGFCDGSTCSGHGNCTDASTAFLCSCKPGYTGPTCSLDVNECIASPCQNGGSCNNTMGSYTCTCSQDYVGATCDTAMLRPSSQDSRRTTIILTVVMCVVIVGIFLIVFIILKKGILRSSTQGPTGKLISSTSGLELDGGPQSSLRENNFYETSLSVLSREPTQTSGNERHHLDPAVSRSQVHEDGVPYGNHDESLSLFTRARQDVQNGHSNTYVTATGAQATAGASHILPLSASEGPSQPSAYCYSYQGIIGKKFSAPVGGSVVDNSFRASEPQEAEYNFLWQSDKDYTGNNPLAQNFNIQKPAIGSSSNLYDTPLPPSFTADDSLTTIKSGSTKEDIYDRIIRPQDESMTFTEPPQDDGELYSHLQHAHYNQLDRKELSTTHLQDAGDFSCTYQGTLTMCEEISCPFPATAHLRPSEPYLRHLQDDIALPVSIKVANENIQDRRRLLREAAVLGQFSHGNIVRLCGIVSDGDPVMMAVEVLEHGDLKAYLQSLIPSLARGTLQAKKCSPNPLHEQLLSIAVQISEAMSYLESQRFVIRNLMASNVLVDKNRTCKIADFSLSHKLAGAFYEDKEAIAAFQWAAPEVLTEGTFSLASDVWSFGVVLFEIFSLGNQPYGNWPLEEVLAFITESKSRLPPARLCTKAMYEVMMNCWHYDPNRRPQFQRICYDFRQKKQYFLQPAASIPDDEGFDSAASWQNNNMFMDLQLMYKY